MKVIDSENTVRVCINELTEGKFFRYAGTIYTVWGQRDIKGYFKCFRPDLEVTQFWRPETLVTPVKVKIVVESENENC